MTKASDNDFPSILLTEQSGAPTSPAAGKQRAYIRTSDHTLVTVNSSGTVTPVGGGSGISAARLVPSSDCHLDSQNPTTNYDSSTTFTIGSDWSDTTYTRFGLMTFDTSSLSGLTVYRAVLRITRVSSNIQAANVTAGMAVEARRILRAYSPTQATWNQYSTGNNWTTAGAKSDGNDRAATVYGHGGEDRGPVANEIALDLTGLLVESLGAAETTLRIILGHNVPIGQDSVTFASLENATTAYRPKMDVLYD